MAQVEIKYIRKETLLKYWVSSMNIQQQEIFICNLDFGDCFSEIYNKTKPLEWFLKTTLTLTQGLYNCMFVWAILKLHTQTTIFKSEIYHFKDLNEF